MFQGGVVRTLGRTRGSEVGGVSPGAGRESSDLGRVRILTKDSGSSSGLRWMERGRLF